MLLLRDSAMLRGFLNQAYARLGYPQPKDRSEETLRELDCNATLADAVREVATTCNRIRHLDILLSRQADSAWQILKQLEPNVLEDIGQASSAWAEWKWTRAVWERRFRQAANRAAAETGELRLLDVCDPTTLFTFYDLPSEGDYDAIEGGKRSRLGLEPGWLVEWGTDRRFGL